MPRLSNSNSTKLIEDLEKNAAESVWNEVRVQLELALSQHQPILQPQEKLEAVQEHKESDDTK